MSWKGVKKQSIKQEIESWCDEIGIKNYTINNKGEIDVDGEVDLEKKYIKELPYKFGRVKGYFSIRNNKDLTSLKNCPTYVGRSFNCSFCNQLDSLEECPREVGGHIFCSNCKMCFEEEEVRSLCEAKGYICN